LVIYNQLKYIQNKDLGYNRDHVLIIKNAWLLGDKDFSFRDELKGLSGVKNASSSGFLPTSTGSSSTTFFKDHNVDQKRAILSQQWPVDENYIPTLGIRILSGRNFSADMPTDTAALIINEAAAKMLAFNNPLEQFLYVPNDQYGKTFKQYHIIGVMKDFNYQSLRSEVKPMVLLKGQDMGAISVRLNTTNIPALMAQVKKKWISFVPGQQFEYSFMDQDFDNIYRTEQNTGEIFVIFTSLAIIIACLGLFGLAAYAAEQRTKEIGIRKVLGASMSTIVSMLSKDFIKLVIIAICIASPLAWWAMNFWLRDFAYRQNIQWWVIAVAGGAAIIIAFITISFQSIKAALTNPVKSLRSE
jgi:putative ABC transport system permease protein